MNKNYLEQLKDPRWQKKRLEILNRDNFTCQCCGSKENELQVHHKYYDKKKLAWEYDNDCLITLCKDCHEYETKENAECYKNYVSLKESFSNKGLSMSMLNLVLSYIGRNLVRGKELEDDGYSEIYDSVNVLLKNACCGAFNYNNVIVLNKMGVDATELIKDFYPSMIDDFNKKIKLNKKNEK